jgi:translocation and assembly module TamA
MQYRSHIRLHQFCQQLAQRLSIMAMACLLSACALWPAAWKARDSSGTELAQAAVASDSAASQPQRAVYRLDVQAPETLAVLLSKHLELSRFQTVPQSESLDALELNRLIAAAPAQVRALLETEGYFNANVRVSRIPGRSGDLPLVRMQVEPGPRAVVSELSFDIIGELKTLADAGDTRAAEQIRKLRTNWPLQRGEAFRQAQWSEAKSATLRALRTEGYPQVNWVSTRAQVDPAQKTVRLQVLLDTGPLFLLGPIQIEGLVSFPQTVVTHLATHRTGEPYVETTLTEFQQRLQKLGLFDRVSVELDTRAETASAAPLLVRVREQLHQQLILGAGFKANTGLRVTAEHAHRHPFDWNWTVKNKVEIGSSSKWEGDLTSFPQEGSYRNLIAGTLSRERVDDEVLSAWSARLGRTQDTPRIERLYYAEVTQAQLKNTSGSISNAQAVSGNYHWVYRVVDSILLPTDGFTMSAQAAAGYARSSTADRGPFTRLYTRMTWYRPLGQRWYGTARLEAAQIFADQSVGVPETLLFRAGGDDSVRGYAYRSLGVTSNGVVSSGRSLLTGSVEVARPISKQWPQFWWAGFVDAGDASERQSSLRPAVGIGTGLRWRSPVGPLKADLAYGQKVKSFRFHLSVGIAF